jgi:hypothetical protein
MRSSEERDKLMTRTGVADSGSISHLIIMVKFDHWVSRKDLFLMSSFPIISTIRVLHKRRPCAERKTRHQRYE